MTVVQTPGKKLAVYHVECKEADLSEINQDWLTAAQWTAESDQSLAGETVQREADEHNVLISILEANQLIEPEVIFKLSRIFAKIHIIISKGIVNEIPCER